jgi:formiminotetrahydrofolate cyclodeaminase
MGAALLVMVCNLTSGRPRYASVRTDAERIAARAAALRDRALALAAEDEAAYGRVSAAMKLPRDTNQDREIRRERLQGALRDAANPPLEIMRVAVEVLTLALELAPLGNRSAVSDVGSAGYLAAAGFGAARLNVQINVSAVTDAEWTAAMGTVLGEMGDVDDLASRLQHTVAVEMGI